jgi:O-antigen ligase
VPNLLKLHFGLEGIVGPVLYGLAILGWLITVFRSPQVGIYILVPFLPLENARYRLHPYPLGHAFIDVMLLGVGLGLLKQGIPLFPKIRFRTLAIILAVTTFLSVWVGALLMDLPLPFWFNDIRLNDWKNNIIIPIEIFFFTFAAIRTTKQMKILILLTCLLMFGYNRSIYNTITNRDYSSYNEDARIESGNIGQNGLAAMEAQFAFLAFGLQAFATKRLHRIGYLLLGGFCIYCVTFSFSRGAYLAVLLAWLVFAIVKSRILLIPFVLFLASWQVVVPTAVRERVLMTYDTQNHALDDSAEARVTVWQDALEAFQGDPIFGMGYDTYRLLHRVGGYTDTHNLYVKLLVEMGLVGLFIFLALFVRAFQAGYELFRRGTDPFLQGLGLGLALWMVCAMAANLFGDRLNYIQICGPMWAFMACVVRGLWITDNEESPTEEAVGIPAEVLA